MARSEVQEASAAVLDAADAFYDAVGTDRYVECGDRLAGAIEWRRAAIQRQEVETRDVALRHDASPEERQAAQAAMLARPGWRRCLYDLLLHDRPRSDQGLEDLCSTFRGATFLAGDGTRIEIPDRRVSHQSISSARNSLCEVGLVTQAGAEIRNGRQHKTWRAKPIGTVNA